MAARYWVGGTATWDTTAGTKWALTDGGAGGQTVPGTADTVFFTALSGAVTVTWTTASATVVSINSTGFTGTHATGSNNKSLNGTGMVWISPVTCTITGAPTLTASSTGSTLIEVSCNHLSPSATNAPSFAFTLGTYPTNLVGTGFRNITVSAAAGSTVSGTVSLYGNLTILSTSRTFLNFNPTFLAAATITTTSKVIGNTTVNAPGATVTISGALTLGVANTFTLTAGTISLSGLLSAGIFSSSNTNTRAIAFGANNIALSSTAGGTTVLSMADVTNFTYTGTGGFTRVNSATASVNFGTTGGSTTNAPNLTVSSGANNFTIAAGSWFNNLFFSGTSAIVNGSVNMAGNLSINTVASFSGLSATFLASSTFATAGAIQFGGVTVNGAGIAVSITSSIADRPLFTGAVTLTEGTLTLSNTMTYTSISSSNTNVRALTLASGTTAKISGSGANAWNTATSTNLTFTPNTATISMTSASAKTFNGGGLTYYNLNQGGAGTLTISGSNTFNDITNTVQPSTVTFTAGTTQTVSNFSLSGTAASKITINSSIPGTQFNLSKSSGTVTVQNFSIQDSNATGGAGWYAFNSTNLGNTTGWNFQSPNMFAFLL